MLRDSLWYPLVLALTTHAVPAVGQTDSNTVPTIPRGQGPIVHSDTAVRVHVAGIELSGTLTVPDGHVVAAAVLLSVAGPDDRDMSIGPHRLFADLASHLAHAGIATLRYDDRGVGGSGGSWLATSFEDRVQDACAAIRLLRQRVGRVKVGVVGMSEGGGLALRAVTRCEQVMFVALLSAPLRSGREELDAQLDRQVAAAPVPDSIRAAFRREAVRLIDLVQRPPFPSQRDSLLQILSGRFGAMMLPPYRFVPQHPQGRADFLLTPWYRSQVAYDVGDDLRRAAVPIIGIYGALDQNIDPEASRVALVAAQPTATVSLLPSLNHLLQVATTGSPLEYSQLPNGIATAVMDRLATWMKKVL